MNSQEYFRKLHQEDVILAYKGRIAPEILRSVLRTTESNLSATGEKVPTRKKIFNILVELVQNLMKHVDMDAEGERSNSTLMVIKENSDYIISTGNFIYKSSSNNIVNKIEELNKMSKEEIRHYFMENMEKNELSNKGGAGLGLIDIVRKSGEKLEYFIESIDAHTDYLILQIRVVNKAHLDV
jgi:hypothetical protein